MDKINVLRQSIYIGVCSLVCLFPNKLIASCGPSVAAHGPSKEPANYHGNSQTDSFRCAINGGKDLSIEELNSRAALIPEKQSDRFYVRFGLNASSEGVLSIKNTSTSASSKLGQVTDKQFNTSSNNIEMALGYTWTDFAVDIQWLALKNINYNSSLKNLTPNIAYTTTVKGDALLANFYWNFQSLYNFNFYAVGAIGVTNNKCSATILDGPTNVINKKNSVSFGGGIGAKFSILSNVYADMSAKYLRLGELKYEAANAANTTSISLKGARRWLGMSINLIWLL